MNLLTWAVACKRSQAAKKTAGGRNLCLGLLVEASYMTLSEMGKLDTVPVEPVAVTVML